MIETIVSLFLTIHHLFHYRQENPGKKVTSIKQLIASKRAPRPPGARH
jgi:hypothetical protein